MLTQPGSRLFKRSNPWLGTLDHPPVHRSSTRAGEGRRVRRLEVLLMEREDEIDHMIPAVTDSSPLRSAADRSRGRACDARHPSQRLVPRPKGSARQRCARASGRHDALPRCDLDADRRRRLHDGRARSFLRPAAGCRGELRASSEVVYANERDALALAFVRDDQGRPLAHSSSRYFIFPAGTYTPWRGAEALPTGVRSSHSVFRTRESRSRRSRSTRLSASADLTSWR